MKQLSKYMACFALAGAFLAWGCSSDGEGTTPASTNLVSGIELANLTDGQIALAGANPMTAQVVVQTTPANADDSEKYNYDFFSDDPTVFTVDKQGVVTAEGAGEATLTVTAKNNGKVKTSCKVVVASIPLVSFAIDPAYATVSLANKDNFYLRDHITFTPANATARKLTYTSSNSGVVAVDRNGIVNAAGLGTATITVTSADDPSLVRTCSFTVATVLVERIELRSDLVDYYMMPGATFTVSNGIAEASMAKIFPGNAADKGVTYTSSVPTVATVSTTGLITAKAKGTTIVTIKAKDAGGVSTDMRVTVVEFSYEPMPRDKWEVISSTPTLVRTTANGFAACGGPELALDDPDNDTCAGFIKVNASYDGVAGPTSSTGIHFIIDRKETTEFNYLSFSHQMNPGNGLQANYRASICSVLGSDDGETFSIIQAVTLTWNAAGDGVYNVKFGASSTKRYVRFTMTAGVAYNASNTTSNYILVKNIQLGYATPIPNE